MMNDILQEIPNPQSQIPNPPAVLQLIGSFHQGGSERQAVQLTGLLQDDRTYGVFAATLNREGILRTELERRGLEPIPEFPLNSFFDLNFWRQARRCARFIAANRIKLIHTHDFYTNIFGMAAAMLSRGKIVRIASKRETGGMRSSGQKILEKQVFRFSDAIVVNSQAVREYLLREGVAAAKIEVIYNGLDLDRLTPPQITDRTRVCKLLGLPAGENIKFITLVANLRHEVKNHPLFLRAAQKVVREFPAAHFVLAGEGELRAGLEALAGQLNIAGNTHFIGRCTNIPELLAVSDVCVLTSFAEGFSNSILEYMAAGKAVVATDVGGAAEVVLDGETGFLIESDDDEMLAGRLLELLRDEEKARRFGKKGREIVEKKFSPATQLEKTLELYQRKLYGK